MNAFFSVHPIYNLYAADCDGNVINVIKQVPNKGKKKYDGYMRFSIRKHGQSGVKNYLVHRFIWECHNGVIEKGSEIDHINNIRDDNRLCNLQLLTHQKNCKKMVEDRDCVFKIGTAKCVKAININTNEESYYSSMFSAQQHLGICRASASISNNCSGFQKSCLSKKDGHRYIFQCINKEELPDNHKKKQPKSDQEDSQTKKNENLIWIGGIRSLNA